LRVEDGDVAKLDRASGHGKVASHESIAGDVGVTPDTDPSTHRESAGRGRPGLLGVEDSDVAKFDRTSCDGQVASHESISGDVGVAPDANASGHRESTGRGRPRLLGVEDGHITKLNGTSGHGKIASHESVAGNVGITSDADASGHCQRACRGRPRLLGVENRHITKLDRASSHRKVASHERVAADVGVTPDPDPSTHRERACRGRPRLLRIEDGDVAKLDRASGHGKVASHESIAGDVSVTPDTYSSRHREGTRGGRSRLLGVEDGDVAKLDGASGHRKVASHERVAADVGVTPDPDPSTHGEGTRGGRPRLLGVENRHVAKLNGASGHGQVPSHEGIPCNVGVAADTDASGHCQRAGRGRPGLLRVEDGHITKLDGASSDGQVASHERVAADVGVTPDPDPSTHREGACRGRPRLLRIENSHITKLDGTSRDGQVSSHESITGDVGVAADADASRHREGTRGGRSRLLGVEDGDVAKLDGASGHRKVASHESVAADVGVAADPDPSTHGEGTRGGRPRLLRVEYGHITKLNGTSGDGKVTSHEGIPCNVGVTPDPDPSTHRERAGRGRPRLLGIEDGHITKLDGASCDGQVASHERVAADVGVTADPDPSTHCEGTRGGRPRLLGIENRDIPKLDGASGDGQVASHESITRDIRVTPDPDPATYRKCTGGS